MTNATATESATETTPTTLSRNALRRCWQAGYDAALEQTDLTWWVAGKGQPRLEALCDERDADVTTAEGWSAWLMGFAAAMVASDTAGRPEIMDTVMSVAAEKVAELD